ncbi:MAG: Putative thiazole biosynthetic enzyme [Methanobacteriota archaeon]|nr:MAG: Putative thiazole biosynthetic enzyme [Euryarchaeota archaeon]
MGEADWDVVVIGAGPGGGSAALHCARLGLRTLVLEDHAEIGTPVHCGECLSEVAVKNLDLDLPEEVISLHVKGIRVLFPNEVEKKLTEPGYVLEKHLFERWLIDEAVKEGAVFKHSHKVKGMNKNFKLKNQFSNWEILGDGELFPITTKMVIDASGVAGVSSKILKNSNQIEVIAGFQYEMIEVENDGYLDFYIWPKYAPHGYVWMIPKNKGRANVGLVTTEKKGAIKYLNSFISDTYLQNNEKINPPWREGGKKIKPFGGTIPISGPRNNTIDDGLIMIGDAAGFTSPLFEGGSHLAMKSGKYAAEIAKKTIEKGKYSKIDLKEYERLWKSEFPPYHKILKGKTALYNLSNEELAIMASCMPNEMNGMSIFTKIGVGLKILIKRPSLMKKKVISVLLSFGYSRAKYYGW